MILWDKTLEDFGIFENDVNKKSKIWFKCDNCGTEYVLSYKTIMERKRCKRDKCRFCTNKLTERRSSGYYARKSRDKIGRKELYKRWLNKKENNLELYLKSLIYGSLNEDKRNDRNGDIHFDFVLGMLEEQGHKCKLSGIKLTNSKNLSDISIDRINNSFGHVSDNIQLICRGLNIAKNKHANDDIIFFLDCLCGKKIFNPKVFSRDYISHMRRNSEQRDKIRNFNNDLTTDKIVMMFEKQNGLCAITGLPMACYQHPCFSVSADRIDNNLGHVIGNVQLVLKCINRAKSTFSNDDVKQWLNQIKESYHARIN